MSLFSANRCRLIWPCCRSPCDLIPMGFTENYGAAMILNFAYSNGVIILSIQTEKTVQTLYNQNVSLTSVYTICRSISLQLL